MGKGYNNYMTKKPFHPGSKANIKRTWMAEQRTENEKRKQEELKTQYDKEQDLYNNRALLSTESKDKLQLNFMYEAPPGAKRERQKEDDEPEYKFEWQRKYNAPREDYAKGNAEIRDQPFGIPVRNVRCIKCHKWGHINTDKECPLFTHASTSLMPTSSMDPLELMRQMREDGYDLKKSALGHQVNPKQANEQFIPSDNSDPEMDFLKSLSSKQKRKLLKKLNKLSKKQQKKDDQKKKKNKKKEKSKSKRRADSDTESERESKKKQKRKAESMSSESELESSDEDEKPILKDKKAKEVSNKNIKKDTSALKSEKNRSHKQSKSSKQKSSSKNYLESEENPLKIASPKSGATTEKVKRTTNDSKTEKSKEEKKSSKDTQKKDDVKSTKDDSKRQNTDLSKDASTSSAGQDTKVQRPDSDSSNSDTSEGKRDKKNKRLKVESSSQVFLKPGENLATSSGISGKRDCDLLMPRDVELNKASSHPDGFDPRHPQRSSPRGGNVNVHPTKHDQALHDRFRDHHRHRRSPSVKHKYRSD